jgi:hypothetical protein
VGFSSIRAIFYRLACQTTLKKVIYDLHTFEKRVRLYARRFYHFLSVQDLFDLDSLFPVISVVRFLLRPGLPSPSAPAPEALTIQAAIRQFFLPYRQKVGKKVYISQYFPGMNRL